MPTEKISKRNVEALRRDALRKLASSTSKEIIIWDDELIGLGLRVGKRGKASWLVYKRIGQGGVGARQVMTVFGSLGEIPDPSVARDKARPILEAIRNGSNPNSSKRNHRRVDIEAYRNGKLSDLIDTWLEKNPKHGYYGSEVARMIAVDILPSLGANTLARDVTKRDIITLLDGKSQATGRAVFAILRPFFRWCVEREVITKSPCEGLTPPKPVDARERVLSDQELLLVWKAASALAYPWGAYFKLLILTAQRRNEVASMPWSEIDQTRDEWIMPGARTKNGKEHLVHLSAWASDVINSIRCNRDRGKTLVFTTARKTIDGEATDVPISGFSKAKLLLDAKVTELNGKKPIPEWRVHDLRRTAATGMAALGVQPHIVERVLNHISGSTGGLVAVYQRFEYPAQRREAMTLWANHIQQLLLAEFAREREVADNVVPIRA